MTYGYYNIPYKNHNTDIIKKCTYTNIIWGFYMCYKLISSQIMHVCENYIVLFITCDNITFNIGQNMSNIKFSYGETYSNIP